MGDLQVGLGWGPSSGGSRTLLKGCPREATASVSQCYRGNTPRRHHHRCGYPEPTAAPRPRAKRPWRESQANRRTRHTFKDLRFTRFATGGPCLILLCQALVAPGKFRNLITIPDGTST